MKLATLRIAGAERPGVRLTNGNFVDLVAAAEQKILGVGVTSVIDLLDDRTPQTAAVRRLVDEIESGSAFAEEKLRAANGLIAADKAQLAPPIMPKIILSTGQAYRDHLSEMKVAHGPAEPRGFLKAIQAVTGPNDPILLPAHEPDMVDFESEFSCVFGRTCYNVTVDEALDYVAGYTLINDVSSRTVVPDFIRSLSGDDCGRCAELSDKNIFGKQFPTFCPLGPVVTTKDEIPDPHNVSIGTRLNGELMQSANTRDLIFPLAYVIAYFSRWFRFQPGDVLTTGSPAGVGYGRNPPVFMRAGDVVEIFGEGVGSLLNPVENARA